MTPYRAAILRILNIPEVNLRSNVDAKIVAGENGFVDDGEGGWKESEDPRFIEALGMKATDVFKKFMKLYNKNYRYDLAVKQFYLLTDDEIVEMMDELQYFNKSFIGHETFKPTAVNFLKEKIWQSQYPRKINRDRTRKKTIHEVKTWDEYKAILPKENADTIDSYIDLRMDFMDFKKMILGTGKEK